MTEILVAGLRRSLGSLPILLAVPTLLLYFMAGPPGAGSPAESWAPVVVVGGLAGILAWLLYGYVLGYRSVPESVNRRSYDALKSQMDALALTLDGLKPEADTQDHRTLAWKQADRSLRALRETVDDASPNEGWGSGESYVSAWTELHGAETQLCFLVDKEAALSGADLDLLRLSGSRISAKKTLVNKLQCAIELLGGICEQTAEASVVDVDAANTKTTEVDASKTEAAQGGPGDAVSEGSARWGDVERGVREVFAMVNREINQYVDTRYDGLVRLATSLRRWRLLLGLVVYALFVLAILSVDTSVGVGRGLVESFVVFFLIGAGVGAANELRKRSATRPEVDDYGVSQARYLLVPSLAGSAACGGAFIVGLLTTSSLTDLLVGSMGEIEWARLVVASNPALVIVAAVFGLAPSRIFDLLDSLGDSLTNQITTSEATEMASPEDGTGEEER